MITTVTVSAVSYLNTVPFLHGLKQSAVANHIRLLLAPPARCAALLEAGEVDISLTPVAALPALQPVQLISDYCLGAVGPVRTVVLLSDSPLENIHTVYLDPQSRTSVQLARVLAKEFWHITPSFEPLADTVFPLKAGEGVVLIGDKVFSHERQFAYCYDLSDAWIRFTGKPFVFAAWATRKKIDASFIQLFNEALAYGVAHIAEAVAVEASTFDASLAVDYLTNNMNYLFDERKREGLQEFLGYAKGMVN